MNFIRKCSLGIGRAEMGCISNLYIPISSETLDFTGFVVHIEEAAKADDF